MLMNFPTRPGMALSILDVPGSLSYPLLAQTANVWHTYSTI